MPLSQSKESKLIAELKKNYSVVSWGGGAQGLQGEKVDEHT